MTATEPKPAQAELEFQNPIHLIGTCWTCQVKDCPTPKRKQQHPELGCVKWENDPDQRPGESPKTL